VNNETDRTLLHSLFEILDYLVLTCTYNDTYNLVHVLATRDIKKQYIINIVTDLSIIYSDYHQHHLIDCIMISI